MAAKKAKGEKLVGVRMDPSLRAEIEEMGQRRRIRSTSERVRYLINLGLQMDRGQFPQPNPPASGSK